MKAYVMEFEGATAAQYDAVVHAMELDEPGALMPPGLVFHGAGPTERGWRVIDVWENSVAFGRFAAEQIGPLTAKHGMAPPEIEALDVEQVRRGSDGPVSFVQVVRLPGLDRAAFEALDARVVDHGNLPPECVFHVNGLIEGGSYVIDYWTTKAARDEFGETRIKPGIQAAGITVMPTFEDLELHNSMRLAEVGAHA